MLRLGGGTDAKPVVDELVRRGYRRPAFIQLARSAGSPARSRTSSRRTRASVRTHGQLILNAGDGMPMPDQTVTVSFDPPDTDSWVFAPHVVTMTARGRSSSSAILRARDWKFVSVNLLPPDWDIQINPNGNQVVITDPHEPLGEFPYTVTVSYEGMEYTSPEASIGGDVDPPIIMNE